jgi:hypothetical protein
MKEKCLPDGTKMLILFNSKQKENLPISMTNMVSKILPFTYASAYMQNRKIQFLPILSNT